MNFAEYQKKSRKTAVYPKAGSNIYYPSLGLAGEAGEVANKIKKIMRDKDDVITDEDRESLKGELGDVLWYVAQIATELGITLDSVVEKNIEKLMSRMERGKLNGEGDER